MRAYLGYIPGYNCLTIPCQSCLVMYHVGRMRPYVCTCRERPIQIANIGYPGTLHFDLLLNLLPLVMSSK